MDLERRVNRRGFLGGAAHWVRNRAFEATLMGTSVSVINIAFHPDNAKTVWDAVWDGKEINCGHHVEPANNLNCPYDAIVVPGAGRIPIGRAPDGRKTYIPNPDGKIRLDAAAYAYADKLAPIIIVLDGINTRNEDGVTTRNYLRKPYIELTAETKTIPAEAILSDKDSVNTSTNMGELKKIIDKLGLLNILVVTNDYHEQRTMQAACVRGIHATQRSAEDIIAEHDPTRGDTLKVARQGNKGSLKEKVELGESIIDPYGYAPTIFTLVNNERKRLQVRLGLNFR